MKFINYKILTIIFFIFTGLILALGIRGLPGNPNSTEINQRIWKEDGPLELSPDRGRFALMMSIVEDGSLSFSLPIARFVTPDLGYHDGKYVSLFAPLLSFTIIPGYLIGKIFGISQVGAFSIIALVAFLNALLIRNIALRLNAHPIAALLGSLTFLFATPAFAYGVTLYQHHLSTFFILASIYLIVRYNNFLSLSLIWFIFALSIPLDYPNLFFMLPIAIFALGKIIFVSKNENDIKLNIKYKYILSFTTAIFPMLFFFWFNTASYGNPLQLSGTVPTVKAIDSKGDPIITNTNELEKVDIEKLEEEDEDNGKIAISFFDSRNLLNGFYIHLLSPDRGIIYFTPVILFGIFGWLIFFKKNPNLATLLLSVVGANILLYSMWGDPWGGWAFGSRYLIPSYSILAIMISILLTSYRKNSPLFIIFALALTYSVLVNSLGAITSNSNPPQIEVLALEKQTGLVQKYTYERNWDLLNGNSSKSFVWQSFAKDYFTAPEYYALISSIILYIAISLTIYLRLDNIKSKESK